MGLQWGAQYDDNGYAASIASGETDAFENYAFGDFSLGLSWNYGKSTTNISSNDHLSANAGIAMYHLNKPEQGPGLDKLNREFVAHAELTIGLKGTRIAVVPSALYLQQGQLHEINVGSMVRYTIKEESKYTGFIKETALLLGGYYRVGDAIIPTCRQSSREANYNTNRQTGRQAGQTGRQQGRPTYRQRALFQRKGVCYF